jgi:hypothetical protein
MHYRYTKEDGLCISGLYVDDLIPVGSEKYLIELWAALSKEFETTLIGPIKYCVGLESDRDRENLTLTLHQSSYIADIIYQRNKFRKGISCVIS